MRSNDMFFWFFILVWAFMYGFLISFVVYYLFTGDIIGRVIIVAFLIILILILCCFRREIRNERKELESTNEKIAVLRKALKESLK